jgi:hypothetical protein
MTRDFLVETYTTKRVTVVSAWSEFTEGDLTVRPRSVLDHLCVPQPDGAARERSCG